MKVLLINKFFYLRGGIEKHLFDLAELLKQNGHSVAFFSMQHEKSLPSEWSSYFIKNVEYDRKNNLGKELKILVNTLFSFEAKYKLLKLIDDFKPDIAHVLNFHHQLSPSILFALKEKGVPVVIKLPDYKIVCPSYLLSNHGRLCELCSGQRFYNCLVTKCHKNSLMKSLLVTLESYLHHKILKSYKDVKCFICPSKFLMDKVRQMGLRGNLVHLHNFIEPEMFLPNLEQKERKLIYFGRLSHEKGILTIIEAMKGLDVELELIGSGPLEEDIRNKIKNEGIPNVKLRGYLTGEALFKKIKTSWAAVIASVVYENNPISVMEAFAFGIPVIGSKIGGIPELVREGETGLLFEAGNVKDLRSKIQKMFSESAIAMRMGESARKFAQEELNAQKFYNKLMDIYQSALNSKKVIDAKEK